jgi:hypothetical protein
MPSISALHLVFPVPHGQMFMGRLVPCFLTMKIRKFTLIVGIISVFREVLLSLPLRALSG